jgi:hypothetical protein
MKLRLTNIFIYLFFVPFYNIGHSFAMNSELKIVQVKINDKIAIWPFMESAKLISYTKMNEDGLPENLELIASPSSIAFKFDYFGSSNPQFRYLLKGHQNKWHYLDSCQFVKFKNLRHGKYKLIIQAIEENKVLSNINYEFYYNNISRLALIDFFNFLIILLFIYMVIKMK